MVCHAHIRLLERPCFAKTENEIKRAAVCSNSGALTNVYTSEEDDNVKVVKPMMQG